VTSGEPDPRTVERLLRSLPEWFGIESSLAEYVAAARRMPAYLAWPARSTGQDQDEGQGQERHPVGALLAQRHFPCSAEIYLIAADRALHRRGIGRALVAALEAAWRPASSLVMARWPPRGHHRRALPTA
jgi:ribosomal protein S18 acetylase RimI-like enzyme